MARPCSATRRTATSRRLVVAVGDVEHPGDAVHERREVVRREDRLDAVQDREHAVESCAGVDVLLRQLGERRRRRSRSYCVKTRFQNSTKRSSPPRAGPPSAPKARPCRRRSPSSARTGPSGPSPEVVLAETLDSLGAHADEVTPELGRLVVAHVCTVTQSRSGSMPKPSVIRPPGVGDGAFLEVVAEGEVAHHLEERQVALGGADDVDVRGAKALLDRDRARVGRGLLAR